MSDPVAPCSRPTADAPPLRTSITLPQPGTVLLDVHGEVDTLTAPPLEQALSDLLAEQEADRLVVDLSGVTFLASSGLAVLIRAAHRAADRRLRLRLVTASRAVRRPLQITGSEQLFDMYEDVSAAVD
ncbi:MULTISPECIES: STAS domain-containing protein [unclassified Pseudonocardia]|uniref:STAS domain-containing protein n=1 Tax=unclassified Pseudonocardia TaxID=2619320 RepID=UPI000969D550|nr:MULTISPECIES: STAS domain-containing protein [unclassified Pseudonocardia]MBN9100791.1 STAS domain-containing protein [Pseudonocardia sp.]OJY44144.1 MAG: hypothetical protein BGP03_07360 [Pseudonocardia sp. 73-21]